MEIRQELPEGLKQFESELFAAVHEGLKNFVARFGPLRAGMTVRSERSNIHDCIVEEAKKRVPWIFNKNLFLIRLGDFRLKPKKLDDDLRSSNHPTQLVFNFLKQISALFDTSTINLHLGYQPNPIDLTNSTIWIVCPDGNKIDWAYELRDASAAAPIPPAQVPQPELPTTPRVKPKVVPFVVPNVNVAESKE